MITIYGPSQSSARRSIWALNELGVPYEHKAVNMSEKEHKSETFLAMNPNGKVPVLQDGALTMWESLAINTYLVDAYKPEWIGATAQDRAKVWQWSYWAAINLAVAIDDLAHQAWRKSPDDAHTSRAKENLATFLPILERELEGKSFLVNDTFGLADLNVGGVVLTLSFLHFDLTALPNIAAYITRLESRNALQAIR